MSGIRGGGGEFAVGREVDLCGQAANVGVRRHKVIYEGCVRTRWRMALRDPKGWLRSESFDADRRIALIA